MDEKKFALLIDADNTSYKYIKTIINELTKEGIITIKRIYGDWTSPHMANWKQLLLEYSVMPIQQYSYTTGKNATDSAMIIDAMDILYSNNVDAFCLVSSDSDFTRLAARLRESGKLVIGMGRKQTPKPFIVACNQFKYLDLIAANEGSDESQNEQIAIEATELPQADSITQSSAYSGNTDEGSELTSRSAEIDVKIRIQNAILECIGDSDDEWVLVSQLGNMLIKRYSDFDCRNYGHTKMTSFLQAYGFELKKHRNPNNKTNPNAYDYFVRIKGTD